MSEFLQEKFINLWVNGYSFIIANFILFLGIIIGLFGIIWLIIKCKQKHFKSGFIVSFVSFLIFGCCVWFFIPEFYNFEASLVKCNCSYRNVKCENIAIKRAILPLQKGIYHVYLGQMLHCKWNGKEAIASYKKAHSYIGSYKHKKLWDKVYVPYLLAQDYDTVIEIGKDWKDDALVAYAYIMKHDDINAIKYAKLALPQILQANEDLFSLSYGYTYKILDHSQKSLNTFKKALVEYKDGDTKNLAILKNRFEIYRKGEKMWEDELRENYKL